MRCSRRGAALLGLLAGLTLLRLGVAAIAPLAPDEAYYWVFSHALAPGYLDDPPMVAVWIRAGTAIAGQGALGVRLLGPLAGALGTLLLFDAAELLWGRAAGRRRADVRTDSPPSPSLAPLGGPASQREGANLAQPGLTAAALLNATLLAGVGAVIMTPDTPLLFFWTACLWALARLLDSGRPAWWLAIGLFAGLALASKYTALLLWIGIGLWLVWVPSQRRWWRSPFLWGGTMLGGLVFLPVVLWNAAHGWASFLRQGGRVEDWQPARAVQFLGELVGSQLGLATPVVFVLFLAGVGWAARRGWRQRDPAWALLAALTLPGAAVFAQHALGDRVQGNWPAILYPAAALAAAGLGAGGVAAGGLGAGGVAAGGVAAAGLGAGGLGAGGVAAGGVAAGGAVAGGVAVGRPDSRRWLGLRWPAVGLGLAITLLVYVQAASFALPIPVRIDPIARQLAGWDGLARSVAAVEQAQGAAFVGSDEYGVAAELARALPADTTVLGVAPRWRLFRLPAAAEGDAAGLLVRRVGGSAPVGWREAHLVGEVARTGQGVVVQRFGLWRVEGAAPSLPAVVLPRYAPAGR